MSLLVSPLHRFAQHTLVLKGLLLCALALGGIDVWLSLDELAYIHTLNTQHSLWPAHDQLMALYAYQGRHNVYTAVSMGMSLIIGVAVLGWLYRAKTLCLRLGARDTRYTPAASVFCYFIPVLGLWRPYQAMQELYRCCFAPHHWRQAPSSWWVPLWWVLFLSPLISLALYWPYVSPLWLAPATTSLATMVWANQLALTFSADGLLCTGVLYGLIHAMSKALCGQRDA
ncbi:MAG: DUF4328 domain-containing protein [Neisseriaceae bacterium]|nr:DUF4328 domain-containing protein [Neisseriaceae bacterium]